MQCFQLNCQLNYFQTSNDLGLHLSYLTLDLMSVHHFHFKQRRSSNLPPTVRQMEAPICLEEGQVPYCPQGQAPRGCVGRTTHHNGMMRWDTHDWSHLGPQTMPPCDETMPPPHTHLGMGFEGPCPLEPSTRDRRLRSAHLKCRSFLILGSLPRGAAVHPMEYRTPCDLTLSVGMTTKGCQETTPSISGKAYVEKPPRPQTNRPIMGSCATSVPATDSSKARPSNSSCQARPSNSSCPLLTIQRIRAACDEAISNSVKANRAPIPYLHHLQ